MSIGPGGTGDPHIRKFDEVRFAFKGVHNRTYNLYTLGAFKVYVRVQGVPARGGFAEATCFCGADVHAPDGAIVEVGKDNVTTFRSGGFEVAITRKLCTLDARSHPHRPPDPTPPLPITLRGECAAYLGNDGSFNLFSEGIRVSVAQWACSLDMPGHFGVTQDEPHPLQGIAHLNVEIGSWPDAAARVGEHGLLVDGNRPDARDEDYEVDG